jgi:hypothetical protein
MEVVHTAIGGNVAAEHCQGPHPRPRVSGSVSKRGSSVCGIAGFFYKDTASAGTLGETLVDMCQEMYRRGTDSVGFALYGAPVDDGFILRIGHLEFASVGIHRVRARRVT